MCTQHTNTQTSSWGVAVITSNFMHLEEVVDEWCAIPHLINTYRILSSLCLPCGGCREGRLTVYSSFIVLLVILIVRMKQSPRMYIYSAAGILHAQMTCNI